MAKPVALECRGITKTFGRVVANKNCNLEVYRGEILAILEADSRILKDTAPVVYVGSLGASSVDLTIRAWVANSDYWSVLFDMNEKMYKELPSKGINFPFPQMDVHLKKE